jgi:hypothetical protein
MHVINKNYFVASDILFDYTDNGKLNVVHDSSVVKEVPVWVHAFHKTRRIDTFIFNVQVQRSDSKRDYIRVKCTPRNGRT